MPCVRSCVSSRLQRRLIAARQSLTLYCCIEHTQIHPWEGNDRPERRSGVQMVMVVAVVCLSCSPIAALMLHPRPVGCINVSVQQVVDPWQMTTAATHSHAAACAVTGPSLACVPSTASAVSRRHFNHFELLYRVSVFNFIGSPLGCLDSRLLRRELISKFQDADEVLQKSHDTPDPQANLALTPNQTNPLSNLKLATPRPCFRRRPAHLRHHHRSSGGGGVVMMGRRAAKIAKVKGREDAKRGKAFARIGKKIIMVCCVFRVSCFDVSDFFQVARMRKLFTVGFTRARGDRGGVKREAGSGSGPEFLGHCHLFPEHRKGPPCLKRGCCGSAWNLLAFAAFSNTKNYGGGCMHMLNIPARPSRIAATLGLSPHLCGLIPARPACFLPFR